MLFFSNVALSFCRPHADLPSTLTPFTLLTFKQVVLYGDLVLANTEEVWVVLGFAHYPTVARGPVEVHSFPVAPRTDGIHLDE